MSFLAFNQGTADWLLSKPALLDALCDTLLGDDRVLAELSVTQFVDGPMRIAATTQRDLVAVWSRDYLSGTGDEAWGFIKRDGQLGLLSHQALGREVLERFLYVINQRLQGLLLDGALIHRQHGNGADTCLAGRGASARQLSIAYFERRVESGLHTIVCVGPAYDFSVLTHEAEKVSALLPKLVASANDLIRTLPGRVIGDDDLLPEVRRALQPYTRVETVSEFGDVEVITHPEMIAASDQFRTVGLTFHEWLSADSPLSEVQRRILSSDAIDRHPLRIVGPAGSGKTLLMQLLALRQLSFAKQRDSALRILYITHNSAMADSVRHRFDVLEGAFAGLRGDERRLDITTLVEYGRRQLDLEFTAVIDADAQEAKAFQLEEVTAAIQAVFEQESESVAQSALFAEVAANQDLLPVLARLIMAEISTGIKGHGLESDRRRYVQSEKTLSRLHALMKEPDRNLVFNVFERYNREVFEGLEVLDTDDIALSLLGRLRTPIWELKRRVLGYDYVFVDEAQLFNENERRVLPLLTNSARSHVPIILALDEAQDIYGQSTAGLATLGIPDITSENLSSIHRSTRSIIKLAFFVIQHSTDLFGADFPDFTGIAAQMEEDTHPLAAVPRIERMPEASRSIGKYVVKRIRELRKANIWRLAVICHADVYWDSLVEELKTADLPLHLLMQRGELLPTDAPVVALARPALIGGQEFDAVILVGLEQGLVPPRVIGNDALAAAVEQQAFREIYLAITRARYRVVVVLSAGASPSPVIGKAEQTGLLIRDP